MGTIGGREVQLGSKTVSKRRYRSAQERQQIVEETLRPGASVAIVARAHEVNANQVFCWRKLYRQGQLHGRKDSAELVRVRVSDRVPGGSQKLVKKEVSGVAAGVILIELGNARVRIEGAPDPVSIRATLAALDSLRR